jgi:phosphopantetheine--protein transferase-like protein
MTGMRIGIDIARTDRLARVLEHPRFRRLVFTESELAEADRMAATRAAEHLTGRFCAKEAIAKLLGTGLLRGFAWRHIEVGRDRLGAPHVLLHGGALAAARERGLGPIQVSITHDGGVAACVAVAAPEHPAPAGAGSTPPAGRRRQPSEEAT